MLGVPRDGQFPGRGRQKTLSFGSEADEATLKAQLAEEIAHVRKVRPELVAVADAALDNWTFLEKLRPGADLDTLKEPITFHLSQIHIATGCPSQRR